MLNHYLIQCQVAPSSSDQVLITMLVMPENLAILIEQFLTA